MPGKNTIYKVKANEFEFEFSEEQIDHADLVKRSPTEFNLLHNHSSVNATLVEADVAAKKLIVAVDGESFTVEIKDELDQVLEKMGFGLTANKQIKEIKAPMPGLVLQIVVAEGQEVKEGDKILILGAMKMENSIVIQTNAVIKKIPVVAGQAVEKGQVLVELE